MKTKAIFCLIPLFVFQNPAFAGEIPTPNYQNLNELSLEELLNTEISVASKLNEKVTDAPSSVTVFSHSEIKNMGLNTLDELLNFVPGFQVTRDIEQGTASRISVRGRSTALSESVLFLINGQRMNDLYTGGVSVINRNIPLDNIKQVEIIRGPGSALYGSNAFLGVVNIITEDSLNTASISAGAFGYRNGTINLSSQITEDLKVSTFVKAFSDEGYKFSNLTDLWGHKSDTNDPIKGMDINASLKYKDFSLFVRHMERNLENFMSFGSIYNNGNKESTKQTSINLGYSFKPMENLQTNIFAGYSRELWNSIALLIPKGIKNPNVPNLAENLLAGPYLESYGFNIGFDTIFKPIEINSISLGFTYENSGQNDVRNILNHNPVSLEYQGRLTEFTAPDTNFNLLQNRHIIGAYLQDKHKIGDFLDLTAGIRFDNYSDFGASLNPRAAIIYHSPFDSTVKLMYGRAFRSPNFLELYDKNNPVDFGNKNLKPETIDTIEASVSQNFGFLDGTITFFNNNISNIITLDKPVKDKNNPLNAPGFINKGNENTNGLEVGLNASPIDNLLVRAGYTHLFQSDLPIFPNFGFVALNYKFMNANINVNGIIRDKIQALPNQEAYFVLNSSINYNITDKLNIFGNINNIFDNNYKTISKIPVENGITNRGRTFNLGVFYTL